MKKNLITIIAASAMLASTMAAFAADEPAATYAPDAMPTPVIQGDIMLINDIPQTDVTAVTPSYISNKVTVTEVNEGMISTTTNTEDAQNPENTINFTTYADTIVLNGANGEKAELSEIKEGDTITVFSNAYAPAPLIMPPQYQANVIVVNAEEASSNYDVDTYVKNEDGALVNLANTLQINLGEETKITGLTGKMTTIDELENKDLAVVYTVSTRSIPAQTTPIAIYVLGENEQALAAIEASKATSAPEATAAPETTDMPEATEVPVDFSKITTVKVENETITNVYTDANGNLMLPLRKITETLGFTVEWDGNLRAVMLNGGMYSLKIGENSYIKGRMMPQELSVAPEITNDLTYVPVDYFTEILEMTATLDGENTLVLGNN